LAAESGKTKFANIGPALNRLALLDELLPTVFRIAATVTVVVVEPYRCTVTMSLTGGRGRGRGWKLKLKLKLTQKNAIAVDAALVKNHPVTPCG
jgi:hypothetical protein